jgi:hypothetical protein
VFKLLYCRHENAYSRTRSGSARRLIGSRLVSQLLPSDMTINRPSFFCVVGCVPLLVLALTTCSFANEINDVKATAATFIDEISNLKNATITYDRFAAPRLQRQLSRDSFVQQIGLWYLQFGGSLISKNFIGSEHFGLLPLYNELGNFYFIRFRTRYPLVELFHDIWMEQSTSGAWVIFSHQFTSIPLANR